MAFSVEAEENYGRRGGEIEREKRSKKRPVSTHPELNFCC